MMFKWFRHIWHKIFHLKCYDSVLTKDNRNIKMGRTIYSDGETVKEYVNHQNRMHIWLKGVFLVPGAMLLKRVAGKYLVKEVPPGNQFKNLRAFYKAFEDSLFEWGEMATRMSVGNTKGLNFKRELVHFMTDTHIKVLRTMKELVGTNVINDTSYLNLFDMFLYNLTMEMNKLHSSGIVESGPNEVKHVLFTSRKIDCVSYMHAIGNVPPEVHQIVSLLLQGKYVLDHIDTTKQKPDYLIKAEKGENGTANGRTV